MKLNPLLDTDSYKSSHWLQYPKNCTSMMSYIESRGGKYDETVFFGLQYYLKEYLSMRITMDMVDEANRFFAAHGEPFNYEGWKYIAEELGGKLPVRIRALPEGTITPVHSVMMTIESTDPKVFWAVSWLETMLLRVWYPVTVATQSYTIKKVIWDALNESSDDPQSEIKFKLHDFGSRGVSSQESAGIGGAAHLVNFMGSDTVAGVVTANRIYNHPMAGFSIPAAEHSSITSWGKENETAAYENMLKQFAKPGALVACVSDSYDLFKAVDEIWGQQLKQKIIDSGATVVIRPDSGDPATIVLQTAKLLEKNFGTTINSKGYKVLNNVRIIQGDGINLESIEEILNLLMRNNYSASNVAFGMGGALLQQVNRDTQKFAMKCCSVTVNGQEVDVFKDPITDSGKRSLAGRLDIVRDGNGFKNVRLVNGELSAPGTALQTVYVNGELTCDQSFDDIRMRASFPSVA